MGERNKYIIENWHTLLPILVKDRVDKHGKIFPAISCNESIRTKVLIPSGKPSYIGTCVQTASTSSPNNVASK